MKWIQGWHAGQLALCWVLGLLVEVLLGVRLAYTGNEETVVMFFTMAVSLFVLSWIWFNGRIK